MTLRELCKDSQYTFLAVETKKGTRLTSAPNFFRVSNIKIFKIPSDHDFCFHYLRIIRRGIWIVYRYPLAQNSFLFWNGRSVLMEDDVQQNDSLSLTVGSSPNGERS